MSERYSLLILNLLVFLYDVVRFERAHSNVFAKMWMMLLLSLATLIN